jgi:DNA-binding transcriptional regulator YbjK
MDIETLARLLHEAGREAVLQNKVHKPDGVPVGTIVFKEWDELTEDAREGRRMQAKYIANKCYIRFLDD